MLVIKSIDLREQYTSLLSPVSGFESRADIKNAMREWAPIAEFVKVFGCRPLTDGATYSGGPVSGQVLAPCDDLHSKTKYFRRVAPLRIFKPTRAGAGRWRGNRPRYLHPPRFQSILRSEEDAVGC
jgi:hypothetical protein